MVERSVSPYKAGISSRPNTPSRSATPLQHLSVNNGSSSSNLVEAPRPNRKVPPGCVHLEPLFEQPTSDNTTQRIKSESNQDDDLKPKSHLSEKAQTFLRRYAAGIRWGLKIRNGEIRMLDDEEKEQQQQKQLQHPSKRRKLDYPVCQKCDAESYRPFICLDCAFVGCFLPEESGQASNSHIVQHLRKKRHSLAFDMQFGGLLCAGCNDIVLDPTFEAVLQRELARVSPKVKGSMSGRYLATFDQLPCSNAPSPAACRVPRGLRNMGATCFINVIIQAFLHNPLLRNYFLSDRHNSALCSDSKTCLACEMDKIFNEFFSTQPGKGPHGPTSLLYCLWIDQSSSELSQAGQHDAHELFISLLNSVHSALTCRSLHRTLLPTFQYEDENICNTLFDHFEGSGASGSSSEEGTPLVGSVASCPCVVHRTFSDQLQSDVTCQRCGKVNSTKDPMLDISLDVRPDSIRKKDPLANEGLGDAAASKKNKNKKKDEKKDKVNDREETEEEQHLTICLQRYCSAERLSGDDYTCSACGVSSTATKQLSLFRLPPILCIQLKRFEHNASAIKIDTRVRFPLVLDVREFSTSQVRGGSIKSNPDPEAYIYDLFTVVVHEGSMNTGHYTNFSKWRDQWYRFDDDKVTPAKLSDVLGARAYQLCYKRRILKNLAPNRISSS